MNSNPYLSDGGHSVYRVVGSNPKPESKPGHAESNQFTNKIPWGVYYF